MDWIQGISSLLGIGIASGLNVYAVVLTVGLAQRLGWLHSVPEGLTVFAHPVVLAVAGAFYVAEFVADKVPGFTPVWDGIHTFIRPVGAALVAFSAFGELDPVLRAVAMVAAGGLALGSHATKMGTRLAAHSVPDPVTHSAFSVGEDLSVVGIILLVYNYPWIALPVLLALVVGIGIAVPFLFRVVVFLLRTLRGRALSFVSPDLESEIPAWARENGATIVLGYVRSGTGLGRLRKAYWKLRPGSGNLQVRGWLGQKAVAVNAPGRHVEGLFLDYVELATSDGNPVSLYLTKDWAALYQAAYREAR